MPTQIKICGLSTEATIDAAIAAGASHIGLVHYPPSPRHVDLLRAAALRAYAGGRVRVALLLVNAAPELTAHALQTVRPDVVQFHGMETPEWLRLVKQHGGVEIWKAMGVQSAQTLCDAAAYAGAADRILYDTPAQALPGGTGISFDWSIIATHHHMLPWGLAGGLSPANVAEAIRATGAPLVDVSSGVESAPGVKDVDKIAAFCQRVNGQTSTSRSPE
ncbi:MAG: phosphoribosylanthranilate isomerase [Sphingopyxis sp.]